MDASEIGVIAGAVILIAAVLWFFFGPKKAAAADVGEHGVQEIKITVKGGYAPDVIAVKAGQPVRLDFYRDETASCSEQVVFRDFGVIKDLPAYETTSVEFTPEEPGEYTFTCGMNMMRGKVVVEAG